MTYAEKITQLAERTALRHGITLTQLRDVELLVPQRREILLEIIGKSPVLKIDWLLKILKIPKMYRSRIF
jgi:hypothetical protein